MQWLAVFTGTKNLIKRLLQQPAASSSFEEGYNARLNMSDYTKNPYPPGSANAQEWGSGYLDADNALAW